MDDVGGYNGHGMIGFSKRIDVDATSTRCALSPFPDGWWVVALSSDLRPGKAFERRWMGRLIVAWRDCAGAVCVADAYCPHMGARLSPSAGGRLSGDRLSCPFHGFEYDVSGTCVATPGGPPPSRCTLATYETLETAGFVFAYFGTYDRKPDWTPPAMDDGWSVCKVRRFRVRTHPQDIAENSIDINHQWFVHGWKEGRQSSPVRTDGPYYTAGFAYIGRLNIPGLRRFRYETEATMHIWGLGFVYTESNSDEFGLRVRNWFLASPIDGDYFDAFVAVQTKRYTRCERLRSGPLRGFLDRLIVKMGRSIVMYETGREFKKDMEIWNHRRYEEFPRLCASDGELHKFRRYCRQFYPSKASIVDDNRDGEEAGPIP